VFAVIRSTTLLRSFFLGNRSSNVPLGRSPDLEELTTEIHAVEAVCFLRHVIASSPSKNRRLGDFNNQPLLKVVVSEKLDLDWTV
jgi:hypothetical protein